MDTFDYQDPYQTKNRTSNLIWNVLTTLVLLAAVVLAGVIVSIFLNPFSGLNPFPPPTVPALLQLPTLTPTPLVIFEPTWTPVPSLTPTATFTPRPTETLIPTETPFPLLTPTEASTSSAPASSMPFVVAQGSPVAISSAAFYPELGCNWLGVAGQVLDLSGAPVATGVVIQLSGVLGGKFLEVTSLTGVAPQYGPAGYEFFLLDRPVISNRTVWVQLLDQAGLPMSEKIYFETFDACEKNLIYINFRQVR